MKDKSGFTLLELLAGLFVCSIILIYLLPNVVLNYKYLTEMENKLELKEILYEEILINKDDEFTVVRGKYEIEVKKNKAVIMDIETGEKVEYE